MPFCPPVCGRSNGYADAAVLAWCMKLAEIGRLFAGPLPEIGLVCRDPNDDHVIATAIAVSAEIIVTGDKDLLALSQYQSIRILLAAS